MKDASKKILDTLSSRGHRITDARKNTVEALVHETQPITIQILVNKVESDEVSVYRTVRLLLDEGFLEEVQLPGEVMRYALVHNHGHHHHLICTQCNFVSHIPCDMEKMNAPKNSDFKKIFDHSVTYYGICKGCG